MGFNLLDLAILALFALAAVDGFRRGFVPYLSELGALTAGLGLYVQLRRQAGLQEGVDKVELEAEVRAEAVGLVVELAEFQEHSPMLRERSFRQPM